MASIMADPWIDFGRRLQRRQSQPLRVTWCGLLESVLDHCERHGGGQASVAAAPRRRCLAPAGTSTRSTASRARQHPSPLRHRQRFDGVWLGRSMASTVPIPDAAATTRRGAVSPRWIHVSAVAMKAGESVVEAGLRLGHAGHAMAAPVRGCGAAPSLSTPADRVCPRDGRRAKPRPRSWSMWRTTIATSPVTTTPRSPSA